MSIKKIYRSRIEDYQKEVNLLEKKSRVYAIFRLLIVFFSVAILIVGFQSSIPIGILLLFVCSAVFIFVLNKHWKIDDEKSKNLALKHINQNEIDVLSRQQNIYYNGEQYLKDDHYYSYDLDIFGDFSLFQLINRCKSFQGNALLAKIFSVLPDKKSILDRQQAVNELNPMLEWRQHFLAAIFKVESNHSYDHSTAIEKYIQAGEMKNLKSWYLTYASVLPFLYLIGILGWIFIHPVFQTLVTLIAVITFVIYFRNTKIISEIQNRISQAGILLSGYIEALHHINHQNWTSDYLKAVLRNSKDERKKDIRKIEQLKSLIEKLDYRLNMIVGVILNLFFLWDFRIIYKMKIWQSENQGLIPRLFHQLGTFEMITSLATWAYNHPEYCLPTLDENHFHLEAKKIIHPLMLNENCVANDFVITKSTYINIITGSNMSGKSTFLRTIGINMVLAYSGTVVGAESFACSIAQIVSYMRIKDNLEESVSTFKAELNRVEMILGLLNKKEPVFILIDEMLRGTNSKDKLKGSIAITKNIIANNGYAMIATHDIKLAELESQFPGDINNHYFDIEFQDGELFFDYKLKSGICQNFNASFLLEKIGIK